MTTTTQKINAEQDEVMTEVHRIKDELAAKYGYDVRRIAEAAREAQAKSGRKVVSFAKKRE